MMEQGNYWAVRESAEKGQTDSGKPCVVVEFKLTHRAAGKEWVPLDAEVNRKVYFYLSDKAAPYSLDKLERLGFLGDFDTMEFDGSDGGACELVCNYETYEGKTREKWDLSGRGGSGLQEVGSDVVRRLNALWKQRAKQQGSPAPPDPPPQPATTAAAPDGNGIPF